MILILQFLTVPLFQTAFLRYQLFLQVVLPTFSIAFKPGDNDDQGITLISWDLNQTILNFNR